MPIFEYECKNCSQSFQTLLLGSEQPHCPKCGSTDLTKQISAFAVQAKSDGGGDWEESMGGGCGTCGGPRGPGSCMMD